jgi:hypothetical protein
MAVKHGLYGVKVNTTAIGGVTAQNLGLDDDVNPEALSGEVYARFLSLVRQGLTPAFSTKAIATALGVCGVVGVDLSSSALVLFAQKWAAGSTRASGLVHRSFTYQHGILAPRTLSCDFRGDAVINYEALVGYDGVNDPVVLSDTEAVPEVTDTERFSLGPVKLGNITLDQVTNISIDFGLDLVGEGTDADYWDTYVSIREIKPTLRFTGNAAAAWFAAAGIPLLGKVGTHANSVFFLRKRAAGATFVADGTAEHLKFTAAGLARIEEGFQAAGNETGTVTVVMDLSYDGTNAPLTFTADQMIT